MSFLELEKGLGISPVPDSKDLISLINLSRSFFLPNAFGDVNSLRNAKELWAGGYEFSSLEKHLEKL